MPEINGYFVDCSTLNCKHNREDLSEIHTHDALALLAALSFPTPA